MTHYELSQILRKMYDGAKKGDKVVMIHLFGIKYADQIRQCDCSIKDILKAAEMPESYDTEIHKGMKLSEYVAVK